MEAISLRAYQAFIRERLADGANAEAIAHCRHILEAHPHYLGARLLLARALSAAGEYRESITHYKQVLEIDPNHYDAHLGLSRCAALTGSPDRAIWHLERVVEQVPSDLELKEELKHLYEERDGLAPESIRLSDGALARLYTKSDRYDQAIARLNDALEQAPERHDLRALLLGMYWQSEQIDQVEQAAHDLSERLPNSIDASRIMALRWLQADEPDPDQARPFLEKLAEVDPFLAYQIEHEHPAPDDAFPIVPLEDLPEPVTPQDSPAEPELPAGTDNPIVDSATYVTPSSGGRGIPWPVVGGLLVTGVIGGALLIFGLPGRLGKPPDTDSRPTGTALAAAGEPAETPTNLPAATSTNIPPTATDTPPPTAANTPQEPTDAPTDAPQPWSIPISGDNLDRLGLLSTIPNPLAADENHDPEQDRVWSLSFSADGTMLAASVGAPERPERVFVWDPVTGEPIITLQGASRAAFSPDNLTLATNQEPPGAGENWPVLLLETGSGEIIRALAGHSWYVNSLVWSPNGAVLASGSADGSLFLWNPATGQEYGTLYATDWIDALAWSPDGAALAAGARDGKITVWETRDYRLLYTLVASPRTGVGDVAFSPDGSKLASALVYPVLEPPGGITAQVWEVESGARLLDLPGGIRSLAWHPDGSLLATGELSGGIAIWDASTGEALLKLPGNYGWCDLAWSPDGTMLAAGCDRGKIYQWGITP